MATYIIGDVHGCYAELQQLLEFINYNPQYDRLGFTGDLVNRGPDSLAVLKFIYNLSNPLVVLGNHDLFLLAIGYGIIKSNEYPALDPILKSKEKHNLLDWLRQQPLLIYLQDFQTILVHAGVPPQWQLPEILNKAQWVHEQISGTDYLNVLHILEGNLPYSWNNHLNEAERIRYIINSLTRMRFCAANGALDLSSKGAQSVDSERFRPWFEWYSMPYKILFGHWAALEGHGHKHCQALDTGCVWGGFLTAYRLEDGQRFKIPGSKLNPEGNY